MATMALVAEYDPGAIGAFLKMRRNANIPRGGITPSFSRRSSERARRSLHYIGTSVFGNNVFGICVEKYLQE